MQSDLIKEFRSVKENFEMTTHLVTLLDMRLHDVPDYVETRLYVKYRYLRLLWK